MHTNHQRQFVDPGYLQDSFFGRTRRLASGRAITIHTGGCETHHNAQQHRKHGAKKALRQAERRDALRVIAEQLNGDD